MKNILLGLIILTCIATGTLAQQDPDDPGNPDSLVVSYTHVPDIAAGDSSVVIEIEFVVDELVRTASSGYGWNHDGFVMDSAVWTTAGLDAFDVTALTWAKDDIDSTNFHRQFQTTAFGTVGISSPTTVIRYHGHFTDFVAGDTLRITPDPFVDMLFVDSGFAEISPLWGGDAVYGHTSGVAVIPSSSLPASFELDQNYPNPFNPSTKIRFDIPLRARATLTVFNVLGQKVATLVDEELPPNTYHVDWNGESDDGQKLASGIYFYRLRADELVSTKKMLLLK
jgi:hypothetical protein